MINRRFQKRMGRPWRLVITTILLIGGGLTSFSCSGEQSGGESSLAVPVRVAPVTATELVRTRTYTGTIEGIEQATVRATIPDRIVAVKAKEGESVRRGQIIIAFDRAGSASRYDQTKARYDDARRKLAQDSVLYNQKAISERELDLSETAFRVARADFGSAAELANVTAPVSGIVTDMIARVGRQATPGEALAVIARTDSVRLLIDVPVEEAAELSVGAEADIRLGSETVTAGRIALIANSADRITRTIAVEIAAANDTGRLKPGMYVETALEIERRADALVVPTRALIYTSTGAAVYVIEQDTARYRDVTVGFDSGEQVEVLDGLRVGESVVTVGHNMLDDGVAVTIKETAL